MFGFNIFRRKAVVPPPPVPETKQPAKPVSLTFKLPMPPNEKKRWRVRGAGERTPTPKYSRWLDHCARVAKTRKIPRIEGPAVLTIEVYPGRGKVRDAGARVGAVVDFIKRNKIAAEIMAPHGIILRDPGDGSEGIVVTLSSYNGEKNG
jgi:hypothetical protein